MYVGSECRKVASGGGARERKELFVMARRCRVGVFRDGVCGGGWSWRRIGRRRGRR